MEKSNFTSNIRIINFQKTAIIKDILQISEEILRLHDLAYLNALHPLLQQRLCELQRRQDSRPQFYFRE